MAKVNTVATYDRGDDKVPALVVKDNGDGTFGLFTPDEGNHVVFLASVPEGEGGVTFKV